MCRKESRPFQILCVTNRNLCRAPFLEQIEKVAASGVDGIILREKDLTEEEYEKLAEQVFDLCRKAGVPCVLHHFISAAKNLQAPFLHLSLKEFLEHPNLKEEYPFLKRAGVSVHSLQEAKKAQEEGADYIIAGHIFETDCKKGLPGRGISFLETVCQGVSIPVYAIGGISGRNLEEVKKSGAWGACMMSGFMDENFIKPWDYLCR